jgi:hypothetical protein
VVETPTPAPVETPTPAPVETGTPIVLNPTTTTGTTKTSASSVPNATVSSSAQTNPFTGLSALDFTPHVTKGHQIQLVGQPNFTENMISPAQTYEQFIPEINTGGPVGHYATGGLTGVSSIPTPTSSVTQGSHISLVGQPTFSEHLITPAEYNVQQMPQMQYAADGGIMGYAEGSSPQLTRGHPQFLQGYTSNIGHPKMGLTAFGHKEGGEIEGHNPEFYSEGGLNSIQNRYVTGDGDGTSDSIPAMLANGEFVIPADVVSGLGNGSNEAGAQVLDEFMKVIRQHKRDADPEDLPPESKGPLTYLDEAQKNIKVK